MSLHSYQTSMDLSKRDPPFSSLIMAAMRKADDVNVGKLKGCWPEIWTELYERYHSPGGLLQSERK